MHAKACHRLNQDGYHFYVKPETGVAHHIRRPRKIAAKIVEPMACDYHVAVAIYISFPNCTFRWHSVVIPLYIEHSKECTWIPLTWIPLSFQEYVFKCWTWVPLRTHFPLRSYFPLRTYFPLITWIPLRTSIPLTTWWVPLKTWIPLTTWIPLYRFTPHTYIFHGFRTKYYANALCFTISIHWIILCFRCSHLQTSFHVCSPIYPPLWWKPDDPLRVRQKATSWSLVDPFEGHPAFAN